jgi:hypothetical protein
LKKQARIIYTLQQHDIANQHTGTVAVDVHGNVCKDDEGGKKTIRVNTKKIESCSGKEHHTHKKKTDKGKVSKNRSPNSNKLDDFSLQVSQYNVIYCDSNAKLNQELTVWHTELQRGNPIAQLEIDRRLFVCSILESQQGSVHPMFTEHMEKLYLNYEDTIHAKNLPDLIWIFRCRLMYGVYNTALEESVFRYSIPCIRKSKHPVVVSSSSSLSSTGSGKTKRGKGGVSTARNNISSPLQQDSTNTETMCSVYINIMYGTMLALYPHCSKSPTFHIRKQIFCKLYTLSVSPLEKQTEFVLKYMNLMRLCVMEYFVYVLEQFCNVERELMCKCLNYDVYTNLCQTSSDLFRQNCLQGETLDWDYIDNQAFKTTDKVIRTTRIGIKLSTNPGNIIGIRKLGAVWSGDQQNTELTRRLVLDMPPCFWHTQHGYMYTQMITEWLNKHGIEHNVAILSHNVSVVHQMIHIYQMPTNLVMKQVQSLLQHFDGDSMLLNSVCKKTICLKCIMNIKQACNAHTVVNNTRMCLLTCNLMCNKCNNADFLVKMNLLGKWLQVERHLYYICPYCIQVHCWRGTGMEFMSCCEQQSTTQKDDNTVTLGRSIPKRSGKRQYDCYVCRKQCNNINMSVVRIKTFEMRNIALCSKHCIPQYFHKFIKNTDHLRRYFISNGVQLHYDDT